MENIFIAEKFADYELLDSGEGGKLERFGVVKISRPDPQALWQKSLPETEWKNVDAHFEQTEGRGKWHHNKPFPEPWQISLGGINFILKPSVFKHIGVFPEQSVHWQWLTDKIKYEYTNNANLRMATNEEGKISVLNLFGYTGGASLACAKAGISAMVDIQIVHVDASQFAVDCAVANRDASGLSDAPIRFIVEDVRKFVEREIRRGNKYDIICIDAPVYGKGAKDEVWKLEEDLVPLLANIKKLLSDLPLAVLLNGYASGYSHVTYAQMLSDITKDLSGKITSGELAISQSNSDRLLPAGIFARFEN